jgi:2-keto-4-pentenoate hydratase/2-oxohepta-3-ene-1,7-dioic acid hydratase in catechol pathway
MKLATYQQGNGNQRVGAVVGNQIFDLARSLTLSRAGDAAVASDMLTLIGAGERGLDAARQALDWALTKGAETAHDLSRVKLGPPLPAPGKLFLLAGNYADHILEGGGVFPGKEKMIPRFFMKPTTAIIGTGDTIRVPPSTTFADWELELAVVVGAPGRDLSAAQAEKNIMGYTIFNDISARQLAFRENLPQQEGDRFFDWLVGKWLDTFGPMGPWITTADEIARWDQLEMSLSLNGTVQQHASTGQMIFSPGEALAFISQFVSLAPGDMLSTGTPSGVGSAKKINLKPGDHIHGEIQNLGVLENPVAAW